MKTTIKCKDYNEALGSTPNANCLYELHLMGSVHILAGGIWPDCICVM